MNKNIVKYCFDIKAKSKNGTSSEQKEAIVKRKANQIINQLIWEESNFENAAAICNHDGTKIATNKSKINNTIKVTFHARVLENSKVLQESKIALEEKEWYTGYVLLESLTAQIKTQTTDTYSVLYPLTVDVLHAILTALFLSILEATGWFYFFVESSNKSITLTHLVILLMKVY